LNFETLLVSEPKLHYWIEDVTVMNASSLRLLAVSRPSSTTATGKLLLIGDAVAPNHEYAELPKATAEIENIEKHFAPAGVKVYTRDRATAPAYLDSSPEQFAFIHFVAHGSASRLSPLDSAVILSKSSAEEDSFKLYARDIIRHPLHAKLVTISTCYGAGARAYTGEGLVGLSWAFLRAGAHNVIGALWEVSDASTPRLMDELYGELNKGRSPEAALRSAKLSLLHSDGVFRKPFYWAPFQLYTGS
jgi:CHAT domain-containing protein